MKRRFQLREAFVGTPEFASPEQFAGVCVDIRSDLYSLGVVLWEMVTGHVVFRGSPAEVMYQHQHAPLPLDLLEAVSQPVVVLIKALLEKDPARRFQNPAELLKAMPTMTSAIGSGGAITHESFQNVPVAASSAAAGRTPAGSGPAKFSVARLPVTGGDLFGREEDINFLDDAWANRDVNVVTIVAWVKVMPRSVIIWTRSRELSLKVRYHSYAEHDDFLVKVPAFKEFLRRGWFRHPSRYRKLPSLSTVCTRTV
jgi:serine/threonine protein kinase